MLLSLLRKAFFAGMTLNDIEAYENAFTPRILLRALYVETTATI